MFFDALVEDEHVDLVNCSSGPCNWLCRARNDRVAGSWAEERLQVVRELVRFHGELLQSRHGEEILALVGLFIVTAEDVTIHSGLVTLEGGLGFCRVTVVAGAVVTSAVVL